MDTLITKIKNINETLKKGEPDNYKTDHKGYTGYDPQSIVDAVNGELLGRWSVRTLEHTTYPTKNRKGEIVNNAFVQVELDVSGRVVTTFASHPILDDPGDAFKAAQTDAMKKALSLFSIGNRAYRGLLGK